MQILWLTYLFATLFIPKGTIDSYKATEGWNLFVNIEEYEGEYVIPKRTKCDVPIITFANGKLTFSCETEGATPHYLLKNRKIGG